MPKKPNPDILAEADAAVKHAIRVRRSHARRTERGSKQRIRDVTMAIQRLHEAMKPLRSEIGRFAHGPQTEERRKTHERYRAASDDIQAQRRRLWKMLPPDAREAAKLK
jgi:hypothetical protein